MSFVASPEQIETFKKICTQPAYSQEAIGVEFKTTLEFVKSVIPPGFEPTNDPSGLISVSNWQSNACGDFELSSISVRCKYNGQEGYWTLSLIVSDHHAITWGRESWGEPKKQGTPKLFSNGDRKYGYSERRGVRLIEIEADFSQQLESETNEWIDFEVKAYPAARGTGLQWDPMVMTLKVVDHNVRQATGKGKLTLRGSKSDPFHTIPVLSVGDFSYISGTSDWSLLDERLLCDGEAYLPYLIGRHYDEFSHFKVGPGLPNPFGEQLDDFKASQARHFFSS